MKYETIGAKQVADLIARRPITAPDDWTESDEHAASKIPNEGSDIPPQSKG
jgi:cell division protease FtsH